MATFNLIKDRDGLNRHIRQLEALEELQAAELKNAAKALGHSLSPGNMVKNVLSGDTTSGSFKETLIDTALGLGAGFIGKKLYVGRSSNLLKKMAGSGLQFLLTNFVRKKNS